MATSACLKFVAATFISALLALNASAADVVNRSNDGEEKIRTITQSIRRSIDRHRGNLLVPPHRAERSHQAEISRTVVGRWPLQAAKTAP
jgi:hypothetical protein